MICGFDATAGFRPSVAEDLFETHPRIVKKTGDFFFRVLIRTNIWVGIKT